VDPISAAPRAEELVEEFSVVELDERLEFMECCDYNGNCSCPPPPAPPVKGGDE